MVEIPNLLTDNNLQNLCRLCLKVDDFIVDIFNSTKSNQISLADRLYDFYQIKVSKEDGLPTNICQRCLYFTDNFTEFRDNVRKCEAQLQKHLVSVGIMGSEKLDLIKIQQKENPYYNLNKNQDYSEILPDSEDNLNVTIVDPNQEYESSNDSFSIDSDNPDYPSPIKKSTSENDSKQSTNFDFSPDIPTSSTQNINNNTTINNSNESILDTELTTRNVFLCQYCDKAFKLKNECAEHETHHDLGYPFNCSYCPFRSTARQSLINHIKEIHDPERPYICVLCNKGFVRRSDLKKHTIVHTGVRPFACPVCGKNFSRNTNLTKHMRIHSGVKSHICPKCPRSFVTPGDLMRHQKSHNDFKAFKCSKCESSFTRKDKLLHHERIHLKKETKLVAATNNPTALINNNIGQENLTINNRDRLNFDPENMVISLDPYSDINQGENLEQKNIYQRQQNILHPQIQNQQLDLIGKTKDTIIEQNIINGDNKQQLNASSTVDIMKPTKPQQQKRSRLHICTVCDKSFTRKRELQRHDAIHSGQKPFGCRFCNKRFNHKDKVTRHEHTHTEEKYPCNQCKLVFSKQEALDMHIKVHDLNKLNTPSSHEIQKIPNFLESLQEGVTPQLNFYSEIRPE